MFRRRCKRGFTDSCRGSSPQMMARNWADGYRVVRTESYGRPKESKFQFHINRVIFCIRQTESPAASVLQRFEIRRPLISSVVARTVSQPFCVMKNTDSPNENAKPVWNSSHISPNTLSTARLVYKRRVPSISAATQL